MELVALNMKKQMWNVLESNGWKIVIPETDSKPHGFPEGKQDAELAWMNCPCKPKIDALNKMIVHNSFIDIERIDRQMETL